MVPLLPTWTCGKQLYSTSEKRPGASFFCSSKSIDGLWVSSNLDISNACVMPFGYGVGDHRVFILDIPIESLVSINPVKIVQPAGQCLNSRRPGCSQAYIDSFESNIIKHCLLEWLHEAHTVVYLDTERAWQEIIIDKEGKAYMRRAEKFAES